jgi:hypothetical protein
VPDDAALRLSWAMTEAVDAELRLRTAIVRLRIVQADLQVGQPPPIPLGELREQFMAARDQLSTIVDVLSQA